MKLSDYKNDYYWYSGKASDVARSAAFAGLALVWIFKYEVTGTPRLPVELLIPTALFATAIALDLFQYVLGSVIWGVFHRVHENKLDDKSSDPDLEHEFYITWPIIGCFALKIITVVTGYIFVACYIWRLWNS